MSGDQNNDDSRRSKEANPYQAPRSDLVSPEADANIESGKPDQRSNVLRKAILIGLVGGVLSGLAFMASMRYFHGEFSLLGQLGTTLMIWSSSFAVFGVMTAQRSGQRVARAFQYGVLSIPLYILYVPVCTLGMLPVEAAWFLPVGETFQVIVGSTIAFVLILSGLALIVRKSTSSNVQIGPEGK